MSLRKMFIGVAQVIAVGILIVSLAGCGGFDPEPEQQRMLTVSDKEVIRTSWEPSTNW